MNSVKSICILVYLLLDKNNLVLYKLYFFTKMLLHNLNAYKVAK